jgi:protein ImuA
MPPKRPQTVAKSLPELREALLARPERRFASEPVSCGADLDAVFPEGGLHRGSLVEWLGEGEGCGQATFAFAAACRATSEGGTLVVVDREGTFYPPAAATLGLDPAEIALVRPISDREALWAFDQALRCPAVSVVWGRMESLPGRSYRRLQLSAEEGGTIGFLLRSTRTLSQPAWCDFAVVVNATPTGGAPRHRLEIVRSRDGRTGQGGEFRLDDDGSIRRADDSDGENALRLVSAVDRSAPPRRVARSDQENAGDEKRA